MRQHGDSHNRMLDYLISKLFVLLISDWFLDTLINTRTDVPEMSHLETPDSESLPQSHVGNLINVADTNFRLTHTWIIFVPSPLSLIPSLPPCPTFMGSAAESGRWWPLCSETHLSSKPDLPSNIHCFEMPCCLLPTLVKCSSPYC